MSCLFTKLLFVVSIFVWNEIKFSITEPFCTKLIAQYGARCSIYGDINILKMFLQSNEEVTVAIKTLKEETSAADRDKFLAEACKF